MRARVVIAATVVAIFPARWAFADRSSPAAPLQVDAGLCFDGATLAERIARFTTSPVDPLVGVHVTRTEGGIAFTLVSNGNVVGERTLGLPPATCDDWTDAVALAIALALDANAAQEPPPASAPAPVSTPAPVALPDLRLPGAEHLASPAPPAANPGLTISATALGTAGVLTEPAAGVALGFDHRWTRVFETHLVLLGVMDNSVPMPNYPPVGSAGWIRDNLYATVLDGCAAASVGRTRLRACAGAAFGLLTGNPGIHTVGWAAPTLGADARLPLGRSLALVASVDGFAPVVRPTRPIDTYVGLTLPPVPAYGVGIGGGLAFDL
jgi:hypothetical protein